MEGIITSRWSLVVGHWQIESPEDEKAAMAFRPANDERLTTNDRSLRRRHPQTHIHRGR